MVSVTRGLLPSFLFKCKNSRSGFPHQKNELRTSTERPKRKKEKKNVAPCLPFPFTLTNMRVTFSFPYCTTVMSQFVATHVQMCSEVVVFFSCFLFVSFLHRLNAVLHQLVDSVLIDHERRTKVSSRHQLLEALHRHHESRFNSSWRTDGGVGG